MLYCNNILHLLQARSIVSPMSPRPLEGSEDFTRSLRLVGELLEAEDTPYAIVIVGGAALNLLGIVARATRDVDVIAVAVDPTKPRAIQPPPATFPEPVQRAIDTVARDLNLDPAWLNTGPAAQWRQGLPPGLEPRITWRRFAALTVGIVARQDLIPLKLFAAADNSPSGPHARDLIGLQPTDAELARAAEWVKAQDASPEFPSLVDQVIEYVRAHR